MVEEQKQTSPKNILLAIAIVAIICYSFYSEFIRTSNEIGFLGASKEGRQVLIQTLDSYMEPDIKVDSDFYDHSFVSRILIQEPMRTTIRFDIKGAGDASLSSAENFLSYPDDDFVKQFKRSVFMQEGSEISPDELIKRLKEKNITTMEGFLAGFGFKQFQVYYSGLLCQHK